MSRKTLIIVLGILLLATAVFFLFQWQSLHIAIRSEGFLVSGMRTHMEFHANGSPHRIILTQTKSGENAIALCQRNSLGFWKVVCSDRVDSHDETSVVFVSWFDEHIWQYFQTYDDGAITDYGHGSSQWHWVYYGTNAKELIEFSPEQIPDNVTVGIHQVYGVYLIHVISYEGPSTVVNFPVPELLIENGVIDK